MFSDDAILIVRLFNLNKRQGHTIDQQNDVRTELIIAILIGQFRHHIEAISAVIFEINEAVAVDTIKQNVIKSTAQIVIGQFKGQFCQQSIHIMFGQLLAIDACNAFTEKAAENVGLLMDATIVFL